jgi:hypothetical protein
MMPKYHKNIMSRVKQLLQPLSTPLYKEYKDALKSATRAIQTAEGLVLESKTDRVAYIPPKVAISAVEMETYATSAREWAVEYAYTMEDSAQKEMLECTRMWQALNAYDYLANSKMQRKYSALETERRELVKAQPDTAAGAIQQRDGLRRVRAQVHDLDSRSPIYYFIETLPKAAKTKKADVKQPLKASNGEECMSKARSKPYYMSKADILSAIEADPALKALVGPGYKSKSKDELCTVIFPPKK